MTKENWIKTTYQDFSAGLIVASDCNTYGNGICNGNGNETRTRILRGFSLRSGKNIWRLKYQVYGPTAAFIPVIASLIAKSRGAKWKAETADSFLGFVSMISGIILIIMGIFGFGKYAKLVPNSIIVGFTIGIAVSIALD